MRRRELLVGGWAAAFPGVAAAGALPGKLTFEVWRKGARIGSHAVLVRGSDTPSAEITAEMVVKIGPVPVFHYRHQATEVWAGGRLQRLDSRTVSNGKVETVAARAAGASLTIERAAGARVVAPPETAALTHWNHEALSRPLFNPQSGVLVRERVVRTANDTTTGADGRAIPATRYALTGDADIVDWYDSDGAWCGLRGKVQDGSYVEYRRV